MIFLLWILVLLESLLIKVCNHFEEIFIQTSEKMELWTSGTGFQMYISLFEKKLRTF